MKTATTTTTTRARSALVTGAGRGLGRDIAGLLADRGYRVMITDLDEDTSRAAAAEIGRGALWARVDVRNSGQVGSAVYAASIHISCICPDGIWTPMLFDKLEDPQAALSFSGVLLQAADVVRAVGRVLESPRPVMAVPARRGALARLGAVFPRLGTALLPLMAARGRRKQRTLLRTQGSSRP